MEATISNQTISKRIVTANRPRVGQHRTPSHGVRVSTGSRLHFGMFSFGQPDVPAFGGVGVMIDRPGLSLSVRPAPEFRTAGTLADRTAAVAARLVRQWSLPALPTCEIVIDRAYLDHAGLGLGTQLGLAAAAALVEYLAHDEQDVRDLARLIGRGRRSAVGTYGFEHGGLIVEAGKPSADRDATSPLVAAIRLPPSWRFVLACPNSERGLHGAAEARAFDRLPPVSKSTTGELCRLALLDMIPAARANCFESFSSALYDFGTLAGSCFAAQQGGPFASKRIGTLVELIRNQGVVGVGQTSWGPTVFALLPSQQQAERLVDTLRAIGQCADVEFTIAGPRNHGAVIERE